MRSVFLLFALGTLAAQAQPCTPDAVQQAAASTLKLQQRLLATSVEEMETDVPPALKPILHDFKQSLVETVELTLRCNHPDPGQLQSALAGLLHANLPARKFVPRPPSDKLQSFAGVYGDELSIAVKPVASQANLYSIQLGFAVECGDDNILLLYRRTPSGYRRELAWFNPDLNTVADAHGSMFFYPTVPADPAHPYLVAIVHGTDWCTSTWSAFHVDLLAPAADGKPQAQLAHLDQQFRIDDDPKLKLTADGFELRLTAADLASDVLMRPGVFRYRTTGGKLERIQPIANNARDFVDEWLQAPWSDALRWSDPGSLAALKSVHDRFDYKVHPKDMLGYEEHGPVRACTSAAHLFQATIATEPPLYARLRQDPNAFTMLSITPQLDSGCSGPDLMKKASPPPSARIP